MSGAGRVGDVFAKWDFMCSIEEWQVGRVRSIHALEMLVVVVVWELGLLDLLHTL